MVRRPQGRPLYDVRYAGGPRGLDRIDLEGAHVFRVRGQKKHLGRSSEEAREGIGVREVPLYPIDPSQRTCSVGVASNGPNRHVFRGEQTDEFGPDVSGGARHDDHARSKRPERDAKKVAMESGDTAPRFPSREGSSLNTDGRIARARLSDLRA